MTAEWADSQTTIPGKIRGFDPLSAETPHQPEELSLLVFLALTQRQIIGQSQVI